MSPPRGRAPGECGAEGSQTNQLGGRLGTPEGTTVFLVRWRRPHWRREHADWPGARVYRREHFARRLVRRLAESGAEVEVWTADLGEWSRAEW